MQELGSGGISSVRGAFEREQNLKLGRGNKGKMVGSDKETGLDLVFHRLFK
jgi:hypothetical protein